MPENAYRSWRFEEGGLNKQKVLDKVAVVDKVGRPFMDSMADFESLTKALEAKRHSIPADRRYHLPVIYLLKGKHDLARSHLMRYVAELGDHEDLAAAEYHNFAEKMREQLS